MINVLQNPKKGTVFLSKSPLKIELESSLGKDYLFKIFIKIDGKLFDVQGWSKWDEKNCSINLEQMFDSLFTFKFKEVEATVFTRLDDLIKKVEITVKEYKRVGQTEVDTTEIPPFYVVFSQRLENLRLSDNLLKMSLLPNVVRLNSKAVFSLPVWVNSKSVSVKLQAKTKELFTQTYPVNAKGVFCFSFKLADYITDESELTLTLKSGEDVLEQKIIIENLFLYPTSSIYFRNIFGAFEFIQLFGSFKESLSYKRKKYVLENNTDYIANTDLTVKYRINTGAMLPFELPITESINLCEEAYYLKNDELQPVIPVSKKSKGTDTFKDYIDDFVELQENGLPKQDDSDDYDFNGSIIFDADYMVLTYNFSDGRDLDTRTRVVSPDIGQNTQRDYLGWGVNGKFPTNNPFIEFGGDNTGVGKESVLLNILKLSESFPSLQEIVLDARAWWYNTVGNSPVNLQVAFYKGGAMVKSGYTWVNPTAVNSLNFETDGNVVPGPALRRSSTSGYRIATFKYNFNSKAAVFDVNDTNTPSV